jgi:hypothetical protein
MNINTQKIELAAAQGQLTVTTSAAEYDALVKKIANLQKGISLAEATSRQEAADKAAAERAAAIAAHQASLTTLDELHQAALEADETLFDELAELYVDAAASYAAHEEDAKLAEDLRAEARGLGLPEPASLPLTICNVPVGTLRPDEVLPAIFKQYSLAAGQIADAMKSGQEGVPARPGLDWFAKGSGQFWPRPEPAPVEPAKQPAPEELVQPAESKVVTIKGQ